MRKKLRGAVLVVAALVSLGLPAAAVAREGRGGGHGFNGGGRAYGGGGRAYGGRGYEGGRRFESRDFREGRGHRDWDDRGYRGGGLYFGYGAPYAYGPGYSTPSACGYYDSWGYWHPDPNCYVPYGYGYGY